MLPICAIGYARTGGVDGVARIERKPKELPWNRAAAVPSFISPRVANAREKADLVHHENA
jgi:hypothetical protein